MVLVLSCVVMVVGVGMQAGLFSHYVVTSLCQQPRQPCVRDRFKLYIQGQIQIMSRGGEGAQCGTQGHPF